MRCANAFSPLTKNVCSDSALHALRTANADIQEVRNRMQQGNDAIDSLMHLYDTVSARTESLHHGKACLCIRKSFHSACDALMNEQTQLASTANELRSQLVYYEHVTPIMHVRQNASSLDKFEMLSETDLITSVGDIRGVHAYTVDYRPLYRISHRTCERY